tara:strand:+ start:276 stop:956 length:681 start_codon:yes stop_codon:yes gene_type:complete
MTDIKLYMAPGTCARVPSILLEEVGVDFETQVVRFMKGEHKAPAYKKLNPKGKVPTLIIDGEILTENVAIITYLNDLFPDAELMPHNSRPLEQAQQLADLCFCSSTLHPIVTRIRMPHFFAAKEAARSVWELGCKAMDEYFELISRRLTEGPWWYGEQWSAMDAYLFWVFSRVEGAEYPVDSFVGYKDHHVRMLERPAVQKALAREAEAQAELEAEGLAFIPPKFI